MSPSADHLTVEIHADIRPALRSLRRLRRHLWWTRHPRLVLALAFIGGILSGDAWDLLW